MILVKVELDAGTAAAGLAAATLSTTCTTVAQIDSQIGTLTVTTPFGSGASIVALAAVVLVIIEILALSGAIPEAALAAALVAGAFRMGTAITVAAAGAADLLTGSRGAVCESRECGQNETGEQPGCQPAPRDTGGNQS